MRGEIKEPARRLGDAEKLFQEADLAEDRGDFNKAFRLLLQAAQLGDAGSQLNLGNFYSWGRGVKKNLKKAAFWYETAYRNGYSSGAHNLAIDKRNEGSRMSAMAWFAKAAAMNDGSACLELAKLYLGRQRGRDKAKQLLMRTRTMTPSEVSEDDKEEAARLLIGLTAPYSKK